MKIIKFRAWDPIMGMGEPFEVFDPVFLAQGGTFSEEAIFMQYTGLKDVNGVEAYEGDIIEHSTTEGGIFKRVLSYSEELCTLMVDGFPYYRLHESGFIQPSKLQFVIVGNIYQNPDLL